MTNEGTKLAHETFKHLTTLSSGSILVISTFLIRPGIKNARAAMVGLACLLVSNVLSITLMFSLTKKINGQPTASEYQLDRRQRFALLFFYLGLLCVAFFASSNFF
jgi:hypothetical protein